MKSPGRSTKRERKSKRGEINEHKERERGKVKGGNQWPRDYARVEAQREKGKVKWGNQ
jgi:hypothetical protein